MKAALCSTQLRLRVGRACYMKHAAGSWISQSTVRLLANWCGCRRSCSRWRPPTTPTKHAHTQIRCAGRPPTRLSVFTFLHRSEKKYKTGRDKNRGKETTAPPVHALPVPGGEGGAGGIARCWLRSLPGVGGVDAALIFNLNWSSEEFASLGSTHVCRCVSQMD